MRTAERGEKPSEIASIFRKVAFVVQTVPLILPLLRSCFPLRATSIGNDIVCCDPYSVASCFVRSNNRPNRTVLSGIDREHARPDAINRFCITCTSRVP